jgi:putative transposase
VIFEIIPTLPAMESVGFKAFHSAQATISGIETAHMIRKGQLSEEKIPAYKQFMALAG